MTADAIDYRSALCICVTLFPQIVKTLKSRDLDMLTLPTFIYDVGNLAGLVYRIMISSWPIIAISVVTCCTSSLLMLLIIANKRKLRPQ